MPYEVKLSQLSSREEFEAAVANHIEALKAARKENGKPRPTAHPLVEQCIKRVAYPVISRRPDDFIADYVIIDDMPVEAEAPAPTLEQKKSERVYLVRMAELAAKERLFPQRKFRLLQLDYSDAVKVPEADRTKKQQDAIADFERVIAGFAAIERVGATDEAAIEDLTEDTIDSWQVPTFE